MICWKVGLHSPTFIMHAITSWAISAEYPYFNSQLNFPSKQCGLISRLLRLQHSMAGQAVMASSIDSPMAHTQLWLTLSRRVYFLFLRMQSCEALRRDMEVGSSMTISYDVLPRLTKQESISLTQPYWSIMMEDGLMSPWQVLLFWRQSSTCAREVNILLSQGQGNGLLSLQYLMISSCRVRLAYQYSIQISSCDCNEQGYLMQWMMQLRGEMRWG